MEERIIGKYNVTMLKKDIPGDYCECGQLLPYHISEFFTSEKAVCPKCGQILWVDLAPTDWNKVNVDGWGKL